MITLNRALYAGPGQCCSETELQLPDDLDYVDMIVINVKTCRWFSFLISSWMKKSVHDSLYSFDIGHTSSGLDLML